MTEPACQSVYNTDFIPPLPPPAPASPDMDAWARPPYLGFISTLELMSSASKSYSST